MPETPPADLTRGHIEETRLTEALSTRYLAYALSTIMSRSLPDVRDGLKPVHRRLLFAMQQLKLDPQSGFKKCARVVGDVIGKYHPHGDASVYEALVRLAQDFAARYPLIEGQGNFGNIDGDNAAAMRYTESRLTKVASALLEGLSEDAVDFRPTYDGEESEPIVLPGAFPNLLANGAAGIAVGMATSIPPHNATELCDAALKLIENPDSSTVDLLTCIQGPDFPTGGILVEDRATMIAAYEIGRGGFRLRARWEREELKHGTWHIVVREIPYQVQKSRLIEQIAELLEQKKLPLLADIRDESTEQVRLIIEPKSRTVDPAVLMETLFRATQLETRFPLNMNVLDETRTPIVMGLREVLRAWLKHRQDVLVRRSAHRLSAITRRLEILDGYLTVFLNIDEVIRIIREEDEPKQILMRTFSLSDIQAEAILNMRLRSLRRLEEIELKREHKELSKEAAKLRDLLASEPKRWRAIAAEIATTRKTLGDARRTTIGTAPDVAIVAEEALVEREPITVILSKKLWLRALRGTVTEPSELKFKDGDDLSVTIACHTTDRLCLFASNGRFYTLRAADIPRGRGDGQPLRLMIELAQTDEILAVFLHKPETTHLIASSSGRGFLVKSEDLLTERRAGKQVLTLHEGETARICLEATGDHVAVIGDNRKLLVLPLDKIPLMAKGLGVTLQKYKDGGLRDARVFTLADGLTYGTRTRPEPMRDWRGTRGAPGRLAPGGFPRNGRFSP